MYWVLPVLPTIPVNVQVALPVFVSELLTSRTWAVQSVLLLLRSTKVTVAFRMSPGFGSQGTGGVCAAAQAAQLANPAGTLVGSHCAVMSCTVAMSVMVPVWVESGIL